MNNPNSTLLLFNYTQICENGFFKLSIILIQLNNIFYFIN